MEDEEKKLSEEALKAEPVVHQHVYNPDEEDDDEEEQEANEAQAAELPQKAWYVINTFSQREHQVKDSLEKRAKSFNREDKIFRVICADYQEPVLDENGKQKRSKNKVTGKREPKFKTKNYYPGYIFVERIRTDETWFVVRNTPGVSGITGSSGKGAKPFPIPKEEIEPVLKRMKIDDPDLYSEYKVGDLVKIISGNFAESEGTIEDSEGEIVDIDTTKGEVRIQITLFGRATFVPASFSDIEKADENDTRDYSL